MRFGSVIGTVTLNTCEPSYVGGRFLVVLPVHPTEPYSGKGPLPKGNSLVVYDNLGAGCGDLIAYSESGEAAAAFPEPTPVDAFNGAIVDKIFYDPPGKEAEGPS